MCDSSVESFQNDTVFTVLGSDSRVAVARLSSKSCAELLAGETGEDSFTAQLGLSQRKDP